MKMLSLHQASCALTQIQRLSKAKDGSNRSDHLHSAGIVGIKPAEAKLQNRYRAWKILMAHYHNRVPNQQLEIPITLSLKSDTVPTFVRQETGPAMPAPKCPKLSSTL